MLIPFQKLSYHDVILSLIVQMLMLYAHHLTNCHNYVFYIKVYLKMLCNIVNLMEPKTHRLEVCNTIQNGG